MRATFSTPGIFRTLAHRSFIPVASVTSSDMSHWNTSFSVRMSRERMLSERCVEISDISSCRIPWRSIPSICMLARNLASLTSQRVESSLGPKLALSAPALGQSSECTTTSPSSSMKPSTSSPGTGLQQPARRKLASPLSSYFNTYVSFVLMGVLAGAAGAVVSGCSFAGFRPHRRASRRLVAELCLRRVFTTYSLSTISWLPSR